MTDTIPTATTTQAAARILRERILEGSIPPGSTLRQDALALQLGISRTPLRTALAELARDGLVTYEANRGYAVRAFDLSDIRSAYEARAMLEGLACRLAARCDADSDARAPLLVRLRDCVARGDAILSAGILRPQDLGPYRQMNVDFHEAILNASGNPWVIEFVQRTHNVPLASDRVFYWEDFDIIRRSHDDHHRILAALTQGDGRRAENLMWEHVINAGDILVNRIAPALTGGDGQISHGSQTERDAR